MTRQCNAQMRRLMFPEELSVNNHVKHCQPMMPVLVECHELCCQSKQSQEERARAGGRARCAIARRLKLETVACVGHRLILQLKSRRPKASGPVGSSCATRLVLEAEKERIRKLIITLGDENKKDMDT